MKKLRLFILTLGCALWASFAVSAPVHITIKSKDTGLFHEPYYVVYLADAQGKFLKTIRVMGYSTIHKQALRGWYRNAKRLGEDIDGLSGASLRNGADWNGKIDIADAHIAKGHKIILETSSEEYGNVRQEIVITLDKDNSTQSVQGTKHTDFMRVEL